MADTYNKKSYGVCTNAHREGDHCTWIFFDPRISCVEEGSAGGYFEQLSQIANDIRMTSGRKYTLGLDLGDGIIKISNNFAIDCNFSIQDEITRICDVINSAKVS